MDSTRLRNVRLRNIRLRYGLTKYLNVSSVRKMPYTRAGKFPLPGSRIRTRATNTWTRTRNLLDSDSLSSPAQQDSDLTQDMQDSDSTWTQEYLYLLQLCVQCSRRLSNENV